MAPGKGIITLWLLVLAFREMVLLTFICFHLFGVLASAHVLPGIITEHLLLL